MKKTLLIAIALVSIGFTSCKKDFKCVCTEDNETFEVEIQNSRRPEASLACSAWETSWGGDCKLQ